MATKTLTSRIILRNDTANNWTTNNPVLLKCEIGLETDTGKYKIGDGTSNWQALQYYVNLDQDSKTSLDTLIEMLDGDNFGKVNDVQVNGTTVVTDKVANVSIGVLTTATTAQSEVTSGESFTNNIILHKVAKTGSYNDLLNRLNVVDNLNSTSTTDALSANQGSVLKSMVQALPSAKSFTNIQAMVTAINSYSNAEMNVGTSIFLQEMEVPDFWVYSKADSSVAYTYTDDSAFISAVETSGYVQVGYYNVAMLETAKVDLTDYYTKTEVDNLISSIGGITSISVNGEELEPDSNNNVNIDVDSYIYNYLYKGIDVAPTISIGSGQKYGGNGIQFGDNAGYTKNGSYNILIGDYTNAGRQGIAIGLNAFASADESIQLGLGTNTHEKTFQLWTYQLLDGNTGKVPDERLNDTVLFSEDVLILDGGTSTVTTTMEG